MNVENIRKYVYHNSNNFVSIGLLRCMIFALVYLTGICSVFGIVGRGLLLMITKILIVITLLYIVFVLVLPKLWKSSEFSHRFMVNGCFMLFMVMYFEGVVFLLIFLEENSRFKLGYGVFALAVLLISLVLSFGLTIRNIRYDKLYKKRRAKRKKIHFIAIGASCGVLFGRTILSDLSQNVAIIVAVCCFLMVICICSYGTTNFLKYYYVKKYSFPSDGLEDVIEMQLHPPKKKNTKKSGKRQCV